MNHTQMEAIANKVIDVVKAHTPEDGLPAPQFCELIQGCIYALYQQLNGNLGGRTAMLALGQVLQAVAEDDPNAKVHVDFIPIPQPSSAKH